MRKIAAAAAAHPLALFRDFRLLFAGRVVSAVGDKLFAIAVSWWVINSAGEASRLHLGLVMAVNVAPVVLFGPFLGALADRMDRRRAMLLADAARLALTAALSWAIFSGSLTLPLLYLLCFLVSGFGPMFEASVSASLVRLSSEEKLPEAAAADSSVAQISGVFGAALGSVLMAVLGVAGAFAFNAASYLVSYAAVWAIRTDLAPAPSGASYLEDLKGGLRWLNRNRPLLYLMAAFGAFNFFVGPILIIIPMLVKFTLGATVTWLAVFETFFAAGSAAAAVWLSLRPWRGDAYKGLFVSMLLLGLAFGGLNFTVNKPALCLLLFVAGAALGGGNAVAITLFQRAVPDEMKGRFFSILTTVCYAVLPLTFMVNGLLSQAYSVGLAITLNAGATLALSAVTLALPRPAPEDK